MERFGHLATALNEKQRADMIHGPVEPHIERRGATVDHGICRRGRFDDVDTLRPCTT
jgi:hypothetical protein